jgi:hypothetical protein
MHGLPWWFLWGLAHLPQILCGIALLVAFGLYKLIKALVACRRARRGEVMRLLVLMLIVALAAGCASSPTKLPTLPATVEKVVEVPKPLPPWATRPLPVPAPANGSVEARIKSNDARGKVIELANCHRALAEKISRGESADPATCKPLEVGQ